MQVAKLRMRFRNQIRCEELDDYKQKIRAHVLARINQPPALPQNIQAHFDPTFAHQDAKRPDDELRKIQAIIYDFELNCPDSILQNQFFSMTIDDSQGSNTTSRAPSMNSWQKNTDNFSLKELETITDACLRSQREGKLYFNVLECLERVPRIFYNVIDKKMPLLLQETNISQSKLFQRLKRVWAVCQKILMNHFIQKFIEDQLSEEENIFLVNMVIYKIIFLHKYELLKHEPIIKENILKFNFLFESSSNFENEALHDKIKAVFLFLKSFQTFSKLLPTDGQNFINFIHTHIDILSSMQTKLRPHYPLEFIDSIIIMLQLLWKQIPLCQGGGNRRLTQKNEYIFTKILRFGVMISQAIDFPTGIQLKEYFIVNLLVLIYNNRLYENSSYYEQIVRICTDSVFANTKNDILDFWAIQILGRTHSVDALMKLTIHYTYTLHVANENEREHIETCICFIRNILSYFNKDASSL